MAGKFSLKWNEFQTNAAASFKRLRNEDDFYDVTLVSDDQQQLSAHKLVLSSCSDYFKNILKRNKNSHLTLCLEGISFTELNSVLDYIYNGELQIFQEDLDRFMAIGQRLKLEGLLTENDTKHTNEEQEAEETYIEGNQFVETMMDQSDSFDNKIEVEVNQNRNVKTKKYENASTKTIIATNIDNEADVDQMIIENIAENEDGKKCCGVCGKTSKTTQDLKRHVETHIDGLSFSCQKCDKTFRSRESRRRHIMIIHSIQV